MHPYEHCPSVSKPLLGLALLRLLPAGVALWFHLLGRHAIPTFPHFQAFPPTFPHDRDKAQPGA
jgi:hypothetical protein